MGIHFGRLSSQTIHVRPANSIHQIESDTDHTVSLALINEELYTSLTGGDESPFQTVYYLPLNVLREKPPNRRHDESPNPFAVVLEKQEGQGFNALCIPYYNFNGTILPAPLERSEKFALHKYQVNGQTINKEYEGTDFTSNERPFILDAIELYERHHNPQSQFERIE